MVSELVTALIGVAGIVAGVLLQSRLDILNSKKALITETRLKIYSSLWSALVELSDRGDDLWEEATLQNLSKFSEALRGLRTELNKSRIVLDEPEYKEVFGVLKHFESYQIGKLRLIEIRDTKNIYVEDITSMIRNNHQAKETYKRAMDKILPYIKKQTL